MLNKFLTLVSFSLMALFSSNPDMGDYRVFVQRRMLDFANIYPAIDIIHHTPLGPLSVKFIGDHTQRYDMLLFSLYSVHLHTYYLNKDVKIKVIGICKNFYIIESSYPKLKG